MALPVDVNEVRTIIDSDQDDPTIEAMIATADILIQEELKPSSLYSDARLEEIEKWLAAHFVASGTSISGDITQEQAGNDVITYASRGIYGEMLKSTRYGQQALLLDSKGFLQKLGKQRAEFVVGKASGKLARDRENDTW